MKFFFLVAFFLLLSNCSSDTSSAKTEKVEDLSNLEYTGKKANNNTLTIHELSDPDKLNPITSTGAGATYIEHNIFMYLLDVDKEKLEVIPWLAKSRPSISEVSEGEYAGGLKIDYEIKEEALWDNGTPVTAYDIAFSMKATLNPHVDAEHQRPYIDFIKEIVIDKENPKKFSFLTKEKNYAAEFSSGGTIHTIPEYVYDPNGIMRNYSIKQLSNEETLGKIYDNKDLRQFGKDFNSEYFQREKVEGCGPYKFEKWTTGERIILSKKENWWGEKYQPAKSFENYPDELLYRIVKDQVTAVTAMKDEQIDLMRNIKPAEYSNLLTNKQFKSRFELSNQKSLSYTYIGINTKNEILEDKNIRKALAHTVDVSQIIKVLNYGYAEKIASFVHPSKSYYNKDLSPYEFDLQKAVSYLEEAGYINFDDDGVRYKLEGGEEKKLIFTIKYNTGNDRREAISLFMKENAKKIGIKIEPKPTEWTVYLDECKNHDFDLYVLGWIQEAVLDDPKQLFHTEGINGGSNYTSFGDEYTDELIEKIRIEMNGDKRSVLMKELQDIVYDEVPYIFLYAPNNLMAIHKRFKNSKTYIARPGYDERELNIAK